MDALTATWVNATKKALQSLQENYCRNQALLLTEGDLECHLFAELLKQDCISGCHTSADPGYKTTYVHSQVTWFKPEKLSGFEVDLTICDPKKLQVKKLELFEDYPSKGFAYDGECVAIELKFLRHEHRARHTSTEDFIKLRDEVIPAKLHNIEAEKYKVSSPDNIAFISIVGCKTEETYKIAKHYLGKHLEDETKPCPDNLLVGVFYQNELTWNKAELINYFKTYETLAEYKR